MVNNTTEQNKMTQLQNILANVNGASFISIDSLTEVKLKGGKSNPFQGRVTKHMTGASVMVFQNKKSNAYENMVFRRLEKEGKNPASFVLGERAWGKRIPETPFIEHNGGIYLEVIFLKPGKTQILVDGKPYSGEIPGLEAPKVDEESQGGLDDKVVIRTFKADSIKTVRVDHQVFAL
jgi:hypothetical protein